MTQKKPKTTKPARETRKAPKKAPKATPLADAPGAEAKPRTRDPRLPAAGTVLTRTYKGTEVKVTVLEEGFRCDGKEYRSLSSLAAALTGYKAINGFAWMHLTTPRADDAATETKPARNTGKTAGTKLTPAKPAKRKRAANKDAAHEPATA